MGYKDYLPTSWGENTGEETRRTWTDKLESGFFDKYMTGVGLDVGYAGYLPNVHPVLPNAVGIDLTTPGYDGITLPYLEGSQDFVYSSHTLEHTETPIDFLKDWYRVTKIGGHIIIAVPHRDLYEKKLEPNSYHNGDHKIFFVTSLLVTALELAFPINGYRIRLLEEGDKGYDYSIPPGTHCVGQMEILVVVQKLKTPDWELAK